MTPNPPKYGPNRLKAYLEIHNNVLSQYKNRGFVGPENITSRGFFQENGKGQILISGEIGCSGGIVIGVEKNLSILEVYDADALVQTNWYSYNAFIRNGHNIFRYDNQHEDASFRNHPDPHHKHIFDWRTGDEIRVDWIGAANWLTLGEVIEELYEWYWTNKDELPNPDAYPEINLR